MTFAPDNEANIRFCVLLKLETVNPLTAARWILLSDGEFVGDWVDGTERAWEGRIVGSSSLKFPRQKLRAKKWTPPTCSFSVRLGDRDDAFWDYLDPAVYTWEGSAATVYLVDSDQGGGAGAEVFLEAKVKSGPRGAKINTTLKILLVDARASVVLPCNSFAMPTELRTGFIAPARQDGGGQVLDGAVDATQTTITIAITTGEWIAGRVVVVEDEAMYIVSKAANVLTVVRGYADTTAATHADGLSIHVYRNGPHAPIQDSQPVGGYSSVLSFVFGRESSGKGPCIPIWPQTFEDQGVAELMEWWLSRGKVPGGGLGKVWDKIGAEVTDRGTPTGLIYNDLDAPNDTVGASLHRTPNILLAGSYIEQYGVSLFPDAAWARFDGLTDGAANIHRYPSGIADYLATDATWACGLTSPFYGNRITAWNAGDWYDEYSGVGYWDDICGVCPEIGAHDAPDLMDALHDLGKLVGSVWATREGLLYPFRVYIASGATADFDVTPDNLYQDSVPEVIFDPDGDLCNVLEMSVGQDVLCDPTQGVNGYAAEPIPFVVTAQDDAMIAARGEEIRGKLETEYFWIRPDVAWVYKRLAGTQTEIDQTQHLKTMELAVTDHLLLRKQSAVHMKGKFDHRALSHAHIGKIIEYDYPPYTELQGLIREVTIKIGGGKITVELTSMHLDTWPS